MVEELVLYCAEYFHRASSMQNVNSTLQSVVEHEKARQDHTATRELLTANISWKPQGQGSCIRTVAEILLQLLELSRIKDILCSSLSIVGRFALTEALRRSTAAIATYRLLQRPLQLQKENNSKARRATCSFKGSACNTSYRNESDS